MNWEWGLLGSCVGNNVEGALMCIAHGASGFNAGLQNACEFDSRDTIGLMIDHGATYCKTCKTRAAFHER